jgi:hypothetical protein
MEPDAAEAYILLLIKTLIWIEDRNIIFASFEI